MSDAELLRVIARGGYSPTMDHDGSTQRRLLALASQLEHQERQRSVLASHPPATSWPESDGQ